MDRVTQLVNVADLIDAATSSEPRLEITTMSDVQPRAVEWLWPGYIPVGKITIIDGDPGLAKSCIVLDLAARGSRGLTTPTGSPLDVFDTIIVTSEDDADDTIRPRLDLAGADAARVHVVTDLTLPDDADLLATAIREKRARLVGIDPIVEFLGERVRTASDHAVRRALKPMVKVSRDLRCATVGIRHLSKQQEGRSAVYRGGGSIGFAGLARSVLAVGRDPDIEGQFVMASVKVNLAERPASLAYRLVAANRLAPPRIEWLGESGQTAETLIGSQREDADLKSKTEKLADAIGELVRANGGQMLASDGWSALEKDGFDLSSNDMKYKAVRSAGVESKKQGFDQGWTWRLK